MDRHATGFTLLEMLVTLMLLAVLTAAAAPSFRDLLQGNLAAAHAEALMTSLTLARSEAIKRNLRVVLCKSADGTICTTAGDWAQGWLAFVDRDSDGTLDAGEDVFRTQAALPGEFTLRNTNARDWYAYRPDGSAASSGGLVTGTFRVCPPTGDSSRARRVVTNITGRPVVRVGIGALSCP